MSAERVRLTPDVVVVGAGPAGLTAAAELGARLGDRVLVLDRETEPGGIPRHSDHTGYGVRDLRRVMTGPAYARVLAVRAAQAGATVTTEAMVTGWSGPRSLDVTTPRGLLRVDARAVVLATGARERPQAARRIPGDRPHGVYTTGLLQNLVHASGREVGRRAVVVGAELVSWSAVLTLRGAGCETVLMTSEHASPEAYAALTWSGRATLRVPVARRTRVVRVIGRGRVEGVEVEDVGTGARRVVACDTVVLTGDWIPDNELARSAGLVMDPGSRGPVVDTALRTSASGVFAAGNLVHPVDTADVAALDGRHVAAQVLRHLARSRDLADGVRISVDAPLLWVAPGVLRPSDPAPARHRLLCWTSEVIRRPHVTVRQGGRVLTRRAVRWPAAPGRVFRIPSSVLDGVDRRGDEVRLTVE